MEHRVVKGRGFKIPHLLMGQDQGADIRKGLKESTQSKIS